MIGLEYQFFGLFKRGCSTQVLLNTTFEEEFRTFIDFIFQQVSQIEADLRTVISIK